MQSHSSPRPPRQSGSAVLPIALTSHHGARVRSIVPTSEAKISSDEASGSVFTLRGDQTRIWIGSRSSDTDPMCRRPPLMLSRPGIGDATLHNEELSRPICRDRRRDEYRERTLRHRTEGFRCRRRQRRAAGEQRADGAGQRARTPAGGATSAAHRRLTSVAIRSDSWTSDRLLRSADLSCGHLLICAVDIC